MINFLGFDSFLKYFTRLLTVFLIGQFHMRSEKSIIIKRRILELISVPVKRRHITVLKTCMSFLFSPFCTPQGSTTQ